MIKSRPKIQVRVPREIVPGKDLHVLVMLDCRRPVPVDFVDVTLEGTEQWTFAKSHRKIDLCRLGARIHGAGTLPAGRTELPVRIPLLESAPPSLRTNYGGIEYTLTVHASVPWWPDARGSFELKVVPAAVPSPDTEPARYSSRPSGPQAAEPHAELSLASSWTRAGDLVTGAIALSNVESNRYSEIELALVGTLTLYRQGTTSVLTRIEALRYAVKLSAEQAREGEMIPFQFRVPEDAPPELPFGMRPTADQRTTACVLSLHWYLHADVGVRWGWGPKLHVPFRVLPRSSRPEDAPLRRAPPTVGSDRLRKVWEEVGARFGLVYEGQALRRQLGATALTIRREHRGRDGVFLVAELAYPPLHLDLVVEPASAVRRVIGGGVLIGDGEWDRDHHVIARDPEQSAIVLRKLHPRLPRSKRAELPRIDGTRDPELRRMDDRSMTVDVRESASVLEGFARGAVQLAAIVEEVRADLPPPTAMRAVVDEWRALARALSGSLETSRMCVRGQLGGLPAEARVAFAADGSPLCTWLSVEPSTPLDAEQVFAWRAEMGPASDAIAARFKGSVAELCAVVCQDTTELDLQPDRVLVRLPHPLGLPPTAHGATFAERKLERMAQLAVALRGVAAPYR